MTTDLVKDIDTTVIPGTPGTASYTYNVLTQHLDWFPVQIGPGPTGLPPGNYIRQIIGGNVYPVSGNNVSVFATAALRELWSYDPVVVPAVPPTPAVILHEYNEGWNAGARSNKEFRIDGQVHATVSDGNVGAGFGMAHFSNNDRSLNAINFGFILYNGKIATKWYSSTINQAGSYTSATVFKLTRRGGVVRYYIDGVLVDTQNDPYSFVPMYAMGVLYYGGDSIISPFIGPPDGADITLPKLSVYASAGAAAYASASVSMELMTVSSVYGSFAAVSLKPLRAHGTDHIEGQGEVTMESMTVTAYQTVSLPGPSGAAVGIPYFQLIATSLSGGTGSAAVSMMALRMMAADHAYGAVDVSLPYLLVEGDDPGRTNASMWELATPTASMQAARVAVVVMNEAGVITDAFGAVVYQSAAMAEALVLTDSNAQQIIYNLVMNSSIVVDGSLPIASEGSEAWVVNLDGNASYVYNNFQFNSFARIHGLCYGAKADGIYLLSGETDAGAAIHAYAALGQHNLKSNNEKRLAACYLGVSSTDTMYLKIIVNEGPGQAEYIYSTRASAQSMKTQRVDIGKGLRANYFTFELFNKNGADFELDDVKFEVVDITRRI